MFLVLALLLPLVSALVAGKILAAKTSRFGFGRENFGTRFGELSGGGGAPPLRAFLKNYAFVLATSLALTYLLAAGVVSRLSMTDILLGRLGFFNTEILTLSAVLLAANLVATLTTVVAWGGGRSSVGRLARLRFGRFFLRF